MAERSSTPALEVRDLNVYYGHSHALQGVTLRLDRGVLSVVGRNGMGKTTLCMAIMGLVPVASGDISFGGQSLVGKSPAEIARLGIGYIPQGRRLWPSLTVDEHLRLVGSRGGAWSRERIYSTFPRLAERKSNGGAQLSGGEQQMLAIARALLLNPKLLVMDEPTEGLAPVIVQQVEDMLVRLGQEGGIEVLVIEQNIGVACAVAESIGIMVNGRINRVMESSVLSGNRDLQQAMLGVGRHAHDDPPDATLGEEPPAPTHSTELLRVYMSNPSTPTRWSRQVPVRVIEGSARTMTPEPVAKRVSASVSRSRGTDVVLVCGTLDTKGPELRYVRDIIKGEGINVRMVDLSTSGKPSGADIPPYVIAGFHPRGAAGVFTGDRGSAVAAMTESFERWIRHQDNVAGAIAAGGSGGTALVAPAFRSLQVGVPKFIVSTVASGSTEQYVGPSDITMMHSVADIQGLNSISREVLANGAHAIVGMVKGQRQQRASNDGKPAVGLTMFGVTTPCVQMVSDALQEDFDCLVFHATGIGGRSMERLLDNGMLSAVIDLTTTEVCDMFSGGIFAADEDRFGAPIRSGLPYIGACGALDMVNFNAPETVPERYRGRTFYEHNPQITLMRTSAEENAHMGRWIGQRLNQMTGPVRFFLPEGGVSLLDAPGQPFWDPEADAALFRALEETVRPSSSRQLIRVPNNINDPEFAQLAVKTFREFHSAGRRASVGESHV